MTISYLGGLTVAGAVPGAEAAVNAGMAGIDPGLSNLLSQLGALTAYVPVPIDFSAQLLEAQKLVAGLNAAVTGGLTPPSLDVQLAALQVSIDALQLSVDAINAQLSILTGLQGPLGTAGLHGYAFDGIVTTLGGELAFELSSGVPGGTPTDHANAVVFVTTSSAAWAAMGEIFKVAP